MIDPETLPTSLGAHMKRHTLAYVAGGAVLAIFQVAMNRIDWLSKDAIDGIFAGRPSWSPAAFMLGLGVIAFVARVPGRFFIFNSRRDVEYEVRPLLLSRLRRLGGA